MEETGRAVQLFRPRPDAVYSLQALGRLARVPPRTILVYCNHHLLSPVEDARWGAYYFDEEAIIRLRRIENLRARFGVNIEGLKFIFRLMEEVQHLRYQQQVFAE